MQVTIRNQRLLRILGFAPADPTNPKGLVVGLSIRNWFGVIRRRITQCAVG